MSKNTPPRNPFVQGTPQDEALKLLLYGEWGVGKTRLAVAVGQMLAKKAGKKLAVLSTQGGAEYLLRLGFQFDILKGGTTKELRETIDYLASSAGRQEYAALVIDPVSTIYQYEQYVQQNVVENRALRKRRDPSEENLSPSEWGRIKRNLNGIGVDLVNLPQHVLATANESAEYEENGNQLRKVGTKAEMDKGWNHLFSFVGRMSKNGSTRSVRFEKTRGDEVAIFTDYPNPSPEIFAHFGEVSAQWNQVADPSEAARRDALEYAPAPETEKAVREVVSKLGKQAVDYLTANWSDLMRNEEAAQETLGRMKAKLEEQNAPKKTEPEPKAEPAEEPQEQKEAA